MTGIGGGEVVLPGNARSGFYTITWTGDHYTNEDSFPRVIGVDGNLQEGSSAPFAFDVASVAYGVNPGAGPSGKIVVGAGGEGWSITVSPISALPPLPDSGGFDAYLYDGTEREITLKSANSGRVFLSQYDGVGTIDTNRGGLDDGSSSVTLLQGPTVVNVFLESPEPWAIIGG